MPKAEECIEGVFTVFTTDLVAVTNEPGIKDLPIPVRIAFARALIAEREGRRQLAEEYLLRAINILTTI